MKKIIIILILFSITIIGTILIIKLKAESIFQKSLSIAQGRMTVRMNTNETVYLNSSRLDTLFAQDENDKIVLFIPSTYSNIIAQETINLIEEYNEQSGNPDLFWILTNDQKDCIDTLFSSINYKKRINIPGLAFRSETNDEQAFLFTFNKKGKISNVLWAIDIKSKSLDKYFIEKLN